MYRRGYAVVGLNRVTQQFSIKLLAFRYVVEEPSMPLRRPARYEKRPQGAYIMLAAIQPYDIQSLGKYQLSSLSLPKHSFFKKKSIHKLSRTFIYHVLIK
jgi:hypothetical protein